MKAILGLLIILLSGCSSLDTTITPPPQTSSWEDHQHQVSRLNNWQLKGKIGIRSEKNQQSASLYWLQEQDKYQIDIRGPWGQGGASINGDEKHVVVDVSGDKKYQGSHVEEILQNQLGWQLPISEIYWWIRGLPSPNNDPEFTLKNNRLNHLKQSGWSIDYIRYNNLLPTLPEKIKLTHDSLMITLIINEWTPL